MKISELQIVTQASTPFSPAELAASPAAQWVLRAGIPALGWLQSLLLGTHVKEGRR